MNVYYVIKLRNLIGVLIDSIIELTIEKDSMNKNPDMFSKEKIALNVHKSVIWRTIDSSRHWKSRTQERIEHN